MNSEGERHSNKIWTVWVRAAMLAVVYAVLTVLPPFNSIGYGPVQVRVAECLTVLPFIASWAPWGIYLGCILANLYSPFFLWDVTLGAFSSLLAAFLTARMPKAYLAPLPPVLLNAILVSLYVAPLSGLKFWTVALYIGLGEIIACYGLGYPLLLFIMKNKRLERVIRGA